MNQHVFHLDPGTYERHLIHTRERDWAETNCYVDVLIELLHGWGYDPVAALPFTLAIDFEGDQWTFFKYQHTDLRELYGLDIQELAVWQPLVDHIEEQVTLGRPVLVELDSFYLPDTEGTAYQRAHVKSTVAVIDIDVAARRAGYFHGQGFYHLTGDDFSNAFRANGNSNPEMLPPYFEFVKRRTNGGLWGTRLVDASLDLLRRQLEMMPEANPFEKFKSRFAVDLEWLSQAPLDVFHQYSFATLRQFGACYELAATYLQWLTDHHIDGLETARAGFAKLSTNAKTLQFQLARAMVRKKPLDLAVLDDMAATWNESVESLRHALETTATLAGVV